jgi:EAL domain-containing protein (putative c-di-GMP-specific phosphodiesterase class I)
MDVKAKKTSLHRWARTRYGSISTGARRNGLLILFLVVTAVATIGVALGTGRLLRESVTESALDGAENTASIFVDVVFDENQFTDGNVDPSAVNKLDDAIGDSHTVGLARLWTRGGTLLYQSHGSTTEEVAPSEGVEEALTGETVSEVTGGDEAAEAHQLEGEAGSEKLLEVYVPINKPGISAPDYVLELYMSYAPVADRISTGTREVNLAVGGAAVFIYLLLVPFLIKASRRLASLGGANPRMERDVSAAIKAGHLVPFYQPKIDLDSGEVAGVEALVRWRHPKRGLLAPGSFLPEIATSAVMTELTHEMLRRSLADVATWELSGRPLSVAVNVPPHTLFTAGFPQAVEAALARAGVPPQRLIIEVTEQVITEEPELAERRVSELRDLGVAVSIDDFGRGYSSLARLSRLGAAELKVDRAFVSRLADHPADLLVTRMVCELGHTLGMRVVAEGVELDGDLEHVLDLPCELAQGFHFARPMDAATLEGWLSSWDRDRRARHWRWRDRRRPAGHPRGA